MNSCVMHAFEVDEDKINIVKINRYNYRAIYKLNKWMNRRLKGPGFNQVRRPAPGFSTIFALFLSYVNNIDGDWFSFVLKK